jgi:hypothetical protein
MASQWGAELDRRTWDALDRRSIKPPLPPPTASSTAPYSPTVGPQQIDVQFIKRATSYAFQAVTGSGTRTSAIGRPAPRQPDTWKGTRSQQVANRDEDSLLCQKPVEP